MLRKMMLSLIKTNAIDVWILLLGFYTRLRFRNKGSCTYNKGHSWNALQYSVQFMNDFANLDLANHNLDQIHRKYDFF